MGSSNRDYMQDDSNSQGPSWGHDVPTTKWLLIVTVIVFFLQTFMTHSRIDAGRPRFAPVATVSTHDPRFTATSVSLQFGRPQVSYIEEWMLLDANKVLHGQIWRLVTYVFCHNRGNLFDIVFNMIALWYLGSMLERMYGSREILCFYLFAAFFCGSIFTAFELKLYLPSPLMGAGPCVMALLTLYAMHFPRQEILFCWIVPVQIRVLLIIYVAVDLYRILQANSGMTPISTVAYLSAELGGVGFGYLYRRFDWHLLGLVESLDLRHVSRNLRRASASRRLKVFTPEPMSNLDEQVDAILAKIHEHGSESLTDRERSILQRASDQAKNRL